MAEPSRSSRPSLGALTPGRAQLLHGTPTSGFKKLHLANSSEKPVDRCDASLATPKHHSSRRESGIELHMLPSQDLRNMSAHGKRFGFTSEQWSAWRAGDQYSDDDNGDNGDGGDCDGDWDGSDGGGGGGEGDGEGEGTWDGWEHAAQQLAEVHDSAEAAEAKAGAVSGGGPAFWTPACAPAWTPEEWLRWSLGEVIDPGATSQDDSPSPSTMEVEAFGVSGVLETRRGRTPAAHKSEGRAAHR